MRRSGPSLPPPTRHPHSGAHPVPRPAPPLSSEREHDGPPEGSGRVSIGSPPPALCPVGFPELRRRFSPSKVGLLTAPGSQGTPAGTCPAASVSPACGGSTAHSKLSETRRTHGGSEGGSPVGERPVVTRREVSRDEAFHTHPSSDRPWPSIPVASAPTSPAGRRVPTLWD